MLSVQYSIELLPFVTKCAKAVNNLTRSKDRSSRIAMNKVNGQSALIRSPSKVIWKVAATTLRYLAFSLSAIRRKSHQVLILFFLKPNHWRTIHLSLVPLMALVFVWLRIGAKPEPTKWTKYYVWRVCATNGQMYLIKAHLAFMWLGRFEGVRFNAEKGLMRKKDPRIALLDHC